MTAYESEADYFKLLFMRRQTSAYGSEAVINDSRKQAKRNPPERVPNVDLVKAVMRLFVAPSQADRALNRTATLQPVPVSR